MLWFLRAFLADTEASAFRALTGDKSDKSVDAVLVDDGAKQVHLVQGKFRQSLGEVSENRDAVLTFADLAALPWAGSKSLQAFYQGLDPLVAQRFQELVQRVRQRKYELRLYFVTTGRCSQSLRNEATDRVFQADGPVEISIFDGAQVATIFKDYLEGVAPAVPTLHLRVASEGAIRTEGAIYRYDPDREIESWVFTMTSQDVGDMYARGGIRLFARNVRGYLGAPNEINQAMAQTVKKEPHNFWYYNNGVTIVCDEAKRETQKGQDVLRVERPQVINGQQTTRTLHDNPSRKASLLVRVIKIPRAPGDDDVYDDLVSEIVRATNWQNAIRPSDLISNDHTQVFLEREMRKRGYQYLRKRQTKGEAKRQFGGQGMFQIKKEELAQAVAACEFDSALVRKGKEGLFDERYYRSIFSTRRLSYYFARYWLMQRVQNAVWGFPNRAYAKWLVLHFAWARLSNGIGTGKSERQFRYACEIGDEDTLWYLRKALELVSKGALRFWREERGIGEKAKDVSTFFQLTGLDVRFARFWKSSRNPHRRAAEKRLTQFRRSLSVIETPD